LAEFQITKRLSAGRSLFGRCVTACTRIIIIIITIIICAYSIIRKKLFIFFFIVLKQRFTIGGRRINRKFELLNASIVYNVVQMNDRTFFFMHLNYYRNRIIYTVEI